MVKNRQKDDYRAKTCKNKKIPLFFKKTYLSTRGFIYDMEMCVSYIKIHDIFITGGLQHKFCLKNSENWT